MSRISAISRITALACATFCCLQLVTDVASAGKLGRYHYLSLELFESDGTKSFLVGSRTIKFSELRGDFFVIARESSGFTVHRVGVDARGKRYDETVLNRQILVRADERLRANRERGGAAPAEAAAPAAAAPSAAAAAAIPARDLLHWNASLSKSPQIAEASDGAVFVSDQATASIYRIKDGDVELLLRGDPAASSRQQLSDPRDIAIDGVNLFIADAKNNAIFSFDTSTRQLTPVVGHYLGAAKLCNDGVPVDAAELRFPFKLTIHNRTLYFSAFDYCGSDSASLSTWRVDLDEKPTPRLHLVGSGSTHDAPPADGPLKNLWQPQALDTSKEIPGLPDGTLIGSFFWHTRENQYSSFFWHAHEDQYTVSCVALVDGSPVQFFSNKSKIEPLDYGRYKDPKNFCIDGFTAVPGGFAVSIRYNGRSRTGMTVTHHRLLIFDGVDMRPPEPNIAMRALSRLVGGAAAPARPDIRTPEIIRPTIACPHAVEIKCLLKGTWTSEERKGAVMNMLARTSGAVCESGGRKQGLATHTAQQKVVADAAGVPDDVAALICEYEHTPPVAGFHERLQLSTLGYFVGDADFEAMRAEILKALNGGKAGPPGTAAASSGACAP